MTLYHHAGPVSPPIRVDGDRRENRVAVDYGNKALHGILLLLALICAPFQARATITAETTSHNGSCAAGTTCTVTIPSTTAGWLLDVEVYVIGTTGRTISTVTTTACNGPWNKGTSWDISDSSIGGENLEAYCLSAVGSVTSIVVTLSATTGDGWDVIVRPYATTATGLVFDNAGSVQNASGTYTGLAPSLTGTNDVIIQAINSGSGSPAFTAINTSYNGLITSTSNADLGSANLLNTASTTKPTWTETGSAAATVASYIAFQEASITITPIGGIGGSVGVGANVSIPSSGSYNLAAHHCVWVPNVSYTLSSGTPTDTAGNTYASKFSYTGGNSAQLQGLIAYDTTANSSNVITIPYSLGTSYSAQLAYDINLGSTHCTSALVDSGATGSATTVTSGSTISQTITTAQASEATITFLSQDSASLTSATSPTGFIVSSVYGSYGMAAYKVWTATQSALAISWSSISPTADYDMFTISIEGTAAASTNYGQQVGGFLPGP